MNLPFSHSEREREMEGFWNPFSSVVLLVPLLMVTVIVVLLQPSGSWFPSWRLYSSSFSCCSTSENPSSFVFVSPPLDLHAKQERTETRSPLSSSPVALPPTLAFSENEASPLEIEPSSSSLFMAAPKSAEQQMNESVTTLQNRTWRRNSKLGKVEATLARARDAIREAAFNQISVEDGDYTPTGPSYWNSFQFHRSYIEMEKIFKVYVYKEGEPPLVHDGPCGSIYSTEGRFIHVMDQGNRFITKDPEEAHAFFLPFSVVKMVSFIYDGRTRDFGPVKRCVADYIHVISTKYGFWERNIGADHFMVSCHDWGLETSKGNPLLYSKSIRVLCNANTSEGFNPSKDASLPEINLERNELVGKIGGPSASHRSILAFFAGGVHGPIRPALLDHWKGKDNEIQVYEYLPQNLSYYDMMRKSKYCLCPSGYEVASPRIVEAIYLDCVPVIISESYVLPFSDVLNWNAFSVRVLASEISNLKKILSGISPRRYLTMQRRVRLVKRHFVVNNPPKRYDVFHMTLHSVWLRRLNQRPRFDLHQQSG